MLRDQSNKAIQALSNLGCATKHWDNWLVFLVSQKLDKSSRKAWDLKLGGTVDYPRYRELDQFLASRIRAFDAIAPVIATEKAQTTSKKKIHLTYRIYRSVFMLIVQSEPSIVSMFYVSQTNSNVLNSLKIRNAV